MMGFGSNRSLVGMGRAQFATYLIASHSCVTARCNQRSPQYAASSRRESPFHSLGITRILTPHMNRWNIPAWLEAEVLARDKDCVYCAWTFDVIATERGKVASWEHIVNDVNIVTRENIVLCCVSCNASKGGKSLAKWLQSAYCQSRGITIDSIAQVARRALDSQGVL